MKKIILMTAISFLVLFFFLYSSWVQAELTSKKKIFIDTKIKSIDDRISRYSQLRKWQILKLVILWLRKQANTENYMIINYMIESLESLHNQKEMMFTPHNSLILRFSRGQNIQEFISTKESQIKNIQSVFLFRNSGKDLSINEINTITKQLKSINSDILIFIDQEWWFVNRYIDFESESQLKEYFQDDYVLARYHFLDQKEQDLLKWAFPKSYWYFPSMGKLWVLYDSYSTEQNKKNFLEIIAYIRLKSLANNGINTYGLVADLNLWNPAISSTSRSFSKHEWKYKSLIDAFIKASNETWVLLYLKHFPWHGAGIIDSHKWILDLTASPEYLKNNMRIFEYFLNNKKNAWWLMLGHIIFPKSLHNDFLRIVSDADFLLTDDLAMQWYKNICGTYLTDSICKETDWIFSTQQIIWNRNLIKVDTQYVENVY